jgi:hypothetical protein
MISPVAVESNEMKPLNSTLALGLIRRVSTEGRAKWLFLLPHVIRTPYENKHLHGWRGREHRAAHHPAGNPRRLCAWYCKRQGDMVRQDPLSNETHPPGEAGGTAVGLKGELLTLGEPIV